MSINDPNNLSKAKWVGCSWQILALSSAVFVGIVGKVMLFPELTDPELVFIVMVKQLFTPFFAGLILCSILAATISTINIQSLICASLITQDLYFPLFNTTSSQKTQLLFTRLAIFIVPIFSLLIAWNKTGVWDLVLYAWSGLGVTFGPIVILSLYSKQLNKYGVMAGLISGGLSAIIGYIVNYIMALVVSKLTQLYLVNTNL
jgi:sodium/proline symporter